MKENDEAFIRLRLLFRRPSVLSLLAGLMLAAGGCSFQPTVDTAVTTENISNRQSSADLRNAPACCSSLRQLPYRPLAEAADLRLEIDDSSPVYHFASGASRFLAFRLPVDGSSFRVELQSLAGRTLLDPSVLLMDSEFRITRVLGKERFRYVPALGLKGDSIDGGFRVDRSYPGNPGNELYMVIFTTPEQMAGQTTLVHPARAYAIARGNQPPAIADPVMSHGSGGEIKLRLVEEQGTVSEEYLPARSQQRLMAEPAGSGAPVAAVPGAQVLPETEAFYREAVAAAVAAGDLDRALRLVEESQRLNIPAIRKHFLKLMRHR